MSVVGLLFLRGGELAVGELRAAVESREVVSRVVRRVVVVVGPASES